jgi:hypothetical protein
MYIKGRGRGCIQRGGIKQTEGGDNGDNISREISRNGKISHRAAIASLVPCISISTAISCALKYSTWLLLGLGLTEELLEVGGHRSHSQRQLRCYQLAPGAHSPQAGFSTPYPQVCIKGLSQKKNRTRGLPAPPVAPRSRSWVP